MTPDKLAIPPHQILLVLGLPSLIGAAGLIAIHRQLLGFVRFRKPARATEPALWGGAEVFLCLALWFLPEMLLVALAMQLNPPPPEAMKEGFVLSLEAISFVNVTSRTISCGLVLLIVARVVGQPLSTLGFRRTSWWNVPATIATYVFLYFPLTLIAICWSLLLSEVFGLEPRLQEPVQDFKRMAEEGDLRSMALLGMLAVVVAPLAEELLFRGLIYGWLRRRAGLLLGAVFSGVLFAAIHFSATAFLPLAVLGCVLAYVYERTGSLWTSILFHAVFNAGSLGLVLLFSESELAG